MHLHPVLQLWITGEKNINNSTVFTGSSRGVVVRDTRVERGAKFATTANDSKRDAMDQS